MSQRFLIIGSGFSGAVLARELAEQIGLKILVLDERLHTAGNCHTERDPATGVMVHAYGPHIFHTSNLRVWDYVRRWGDFRPFVNRIKAVTRSGVYGLPINLHTLNQFFGRRMNPAEARMFLAAQADTSITEPANFEEQALKFLGRPLYEEFFRGYTLKQWGVDPKELPASILQRLPIRFNYDDNYYPSRWQGIPAEGYGTLINRLLDHPLIEVKLNQKWTGGGEEDFAHTFYTGPIDAYFGHAEGRLGYRTVSFERIDAEGDFQGNAALNYAEENVPWTRVTEHKHFAPWEEHARTVAFREFSHETRPDETPYYPKRLAGDKAILARYLERARHLHGVSFLGRLGTYRYLDMHQVIGETLEFADAFVQSLATGSTPPIFPAANL